MSKGPVSLKRMALATGIAGMIISGSMPAAHAATAAAHRVYPGSDDPAVQKARDQRNAPNMYCEKHQTDCE